MRPVEMRPGTTMLAVTPSAAISRASDFDHPTNASRSAFEIARFGIGAITPDEVLVMMRPHLRCRIAGNTRSATAIMESTISSKCRRHSPGSWSIAGVGGGPPVMLTTISTEPISRSMRSMLASITDKSPSRHGSAISFVPAVPMAGSTAARAVSSASASAILAPSSARDNAMARPSPPAPARTSAVLPSIPRFTSCSDDLDGNRPGPARSRARRFQSVLSPKASDAFFVMASACEMYSA